VFPFEMGIKTAASRVKPFASFRAPGWRTRMRSFILSTIYTMPQKTLWILCR
jgi:hypothetical protein